MEDKGGIGPSGVTVKGDEAPDSYRLAPRTEYQQNPSPSPLPGPTAATAAPPPPSSAVSHPPVTSTTPPSGVVGTGSDPTKKKRGRPRKYAPDGTLNPRASSTRPALSPMPISSSISLSGDYSNWKRGKARPVDLVKKSHKFDYESPGPALSYYVGANFTTHIFTVNAGEDVMMKVMSFSQQGSRAICILSATGSISNVTLRQPTTSGGTLTYEGRFEILSFTGSFMPIGNGETKGRSGGMSISLAGQDGRVVGGGLAGLLVAAGPVQVIMGSFIVGHQAEHKQKKPRITEAVSAPPPLLPPPPSFTITTVNTTKPATEELRQQPYGGGSSGVGVVKPTIHTSSSFLINQSSAINPTFQGFGNLNADEDSHSLGDDSRDTPSQSNCELSS
ncbi:PREDICTED: AT-hook motif nuclear-localized protein 6 [Tarenaya hassleriana]|uniref:AT-hook motif nuclear-localized protein 6 n=1 Tax=Tarenaya hassleriana TaxID=28532 RepID=UPI00053C8FD5|nr:PREDICTED: AT-hook motif nuclear-localized protein 6 [Tarenaya hassleriana]